ncbi:MAG: hypothetical protein K0U93_14440, partial [Gammaproteobacteria bacterium]|nr:hypothetical protein [Gammaproteobacteria bacterium]
ILGSEIRVFTARKSQNPRGRKGNELFSLRPSRPLWFTIGSGYAGLGISKEINIQNTASHSAAEWLATRIADFFEWPECVLNAFFRQLNALATPSRDDLNAFDCYS